MARTTAAQHLALAADPIGAVERKRPPAGSERKGHRTEEAEVGGDAGGEGCGIVTALSLSEPMIGRRFECNGTLFAVYHFDNGWAAGRGVDRPGHTVGTGAFEIWQMVRDYEKSAIGESPGRAGAKGD